MRISLYNAIILVLAIVGVWSSVMWGISRLHTGMKVEVVRLGESIRVEISDTEDYVEIFNYAGEPHLHKDIVLTSNGRLVSGITIQGSPDLEKWIEIIFVEDIEGERVTIVHEGSSGVPSYRLVQGSEGRPNKEYLAEVIWSSEPVRLKESVIPVSSE